MDGSEDEEIVPAEARAGHCSTLAEDGKASIFRIRNDGTGKTLVVIAGASLPRLTLGSVPLTPMENCIAQLWIDEIFAKPVSGGNRIVWSLVNPDDADRVDFDLWRWTDGDPTPVRVNGTGLGGRVKFSLTDRSIDAGHDYHYRVEMRTVEGMDHFIGPVTIRVPPEEAEAPREPVDPSSEANFALHCAPNPLAGGTRIRFEMPVADRVAVRVFDVSGRVRRTVFDGEADGGPVTLDWDGRDDTGQAVPSGVYLLRLVSGPGSGLLRIVVSW